MMIRQNRSSSNLRISVTNPNPFSDQQNPSTSSPTSKNPDYLVENPSLIAIPIAMASQIEVQEAQISCLDCKTTNTPLWRCGPAGPRSLCNACGIRYRKKGNDQSHRQKTQKHPRLKEQQKNMEKKPLIINNTDGLSGSNPVKHQVPIGGTASSPSHSHCGEGKNIESRDSMKMRLVDSRKEMMLRKETEKKPSPVPPILPRKQKKEKMKEVQLNIRNKETKKKNSKSRKDLGGGKTEIERAALLLLSLSCASTPSVVFA